MKIVIGITAVLFVWAASATADMVSVSSEEALLRSAPKESNMYVTMNLPRYYPLSKVKSENDFVMVRDFLGRQGWVYASSVSDTESVVVKVSSINVRKGPGKDQKVLFMARQGVTFMVVDKKDQWLEVVHESGKRGWVHNKIVWGL